MEEGSKKNLWDLFLLVLDYHDVVKGVQRDRCPPPVRWLSASNGSDQGWSNTPNQEPHSGRVWSFTWPIVSALLKFGAGNTVLNPAAWRNLYYWRRPLWWKSGDLDEILMTPRNVDDLAISKNLFVEGGKTFLQIKVEAMAADQIEGNPEFLAQLSLSNRIHRLQQSTCRHRCITLA